MAWYEDSDAIEDVVGELEEWASILRMANAVAARIPPSVQCELEKVGGPIEKWRMGIAMAGTSLETRAAMMETVQRAIMLIRIHTADVTPRPSALQAVPALS